MYEIFFNDIPLDSHSVLEAWSDIGWSKWAIWEIRSKQPFSLFYSHNTPTLICCGALANKIWMDKKSGAIIFWKIAFRNTTPLGYVIWLWLCHWEKTGSNYIPNETLKTIKLYNTSWVTILIARSNLFFVIFLIGLPSSSYSTFFLPPLQQRIFVENIYWFIIKERYQKSLNTVIVAQLCHFKMLM